MPTERGEPRAASAGQGLAGGVSGSRMVPSLAKTKSEAHADREGVTASMRLGEIACASLPCIQANTVPGREVGLKTCKWLILRFLGVLGAFPAHYDGTWQPQKYRNRARAFITGVFAAVRHAC